VIGEIELTLEDGTKEKAQILLNEDEAKLKNAADEVDDGNGVGSTYKNADEYVAAMEKVRPNIRKNIIDLPESRAFAKDYAQKIGIADADFDSWFENTFKKYEGQTLNFEAHHIFPIDVLKTNKELKELLYWAEKNGKTFDFNGIDNGMMLQKKSIGLDVTGHTNHPQYNDAISEKITNVINGFHNDNEAAFNAIIDLVNDTKSELKTMVLLGNKNVNEIINF